MRCSGPCLVLARVLARRTGGSELAVTKKDFVLIAATLMETKPVTAAPDAAHQQWHNMVRAFARSLSSTNPRFNRNTFLAACGITD